MAAGFNIPPGFFPGGVPPPGFMQAQQQPSATEIAHHLLARHPATIIIQENSNAPPVARNINVLYVMYKQWMAANDYKLIQQMADGCLLSHYSDSLLLKGGWQNNRECLEVLWREEVQFKGNWEGGNSHVQDFWEPYAPVEAPVEAPSKLSVTNTVD